MFWFLVLGLTILVSCAGKAEKPEKIKDLEYTVQKESELPEELLSKIKEKQKEPFRMTYVTDGYLYIAKGYGIQETSGYSIQITELYEAAEGAGYFARSCQTSVSRMLDDFSDTGVTRSSTTVGTPPPP